MKNTNVKGREQKVKKFMIKYLPIFILLLSVTIMVGSTFAYFSDSTDVDSSFTFDKVELSNETNVGYDGKLQDVIAGSKLVSVPVSFSKAVDSAPIYVRAKISFSLPKEIRDDEKMQQLLHTLRTEIEITLSNEVQNGAVWSERQGDFFYLLNSDNKSTLKVVDDTSTYVLSDSIDIPRSLKQLDDNYQYMKSVNFTIAFEAIQADNVSDDLYATKKIFHEVFPAGEEGTGEIVKVTLKNFDLVNDYEILEMQKGDILYTPSMVIPTYADGNPKLEIDGWYLDSTFITPYEFGNKVEEDITLYPKTTPIAEGLQFIEMYSLARSSDNVVAYKVAQGSCIETDITIPSKYKGLPVVGIAEDGFKQNVNLLSIRLPNTITFIGENAFSGCISLTKIDFPSSLTNVYASAFQDCTSLIDVTSTSLLDWFEVEFTNEYSNPIYYAKTLSIDGATVNSIITPEEIAAISPYAFYNCESLLSVVITENVKVVGEYAFYGCINLKSLFIETGVEEIGPGAFEDCEDLEDITLPDEGCDIGPDAFVDVPGNATIKIPTGTDKINGGTYQGWTNVTEIIIPDGVTDIGEDAFKDCTNVEKIQLPDSITNIGPGAFSGLDNLKKVEIPGGANIGPGAFGDCDNLEEIIFRPPAGGGGDDDDNTIGEDAFIDCDKLKKVGIGSIEAWLKLVFTNKYSNPIYYAKCLYINEVLVVNINVPSTITTINKWALINCESLRAITVNSSVELINDEAFLGCINLDEVTNHSELDIVLQETTHGYVAYYASTLLGADDESKLYTEGDFVFYDGVLIAYVGEATEIVLPQSYKGETYTIAKDTFKGNTKIISVTVPEKLTAIGANAFFGCTNLVQVINNSTLDIKAGATTHGYIAYYVRDLSDGTGESSYANLDGYIFYNDVLIKYVGNATELVLPDYDGKAYSIDKDVFKDKENVTSITIPENVTAIGTGAFSGLSALTEINFNATSLANLAINNNVFYDVGDEAQGITLNIGKGVTRIPNYLFYPNASHAPHITKVVFEDGSECKEIGINAFSNCFYIEEMILPEGLTTIKDSAFSNLNALKTINIPQSLTAISNYAFYNCYNVTTMYYDAAKLNNLAHNNQVFLDVGIRGEGIDLYIGNKVEYIPNYMFDPINARTPKLINVIFEEDSICSSIGAYAFFDSYLLETINLPTSLRTIGTYAFSYCHRLGELEIPEGVTTIESYAFYNNTGMKTLTLPSSLKSIAANAFAATYNITKFYYNPIALNNLGANNYVYSSMGLSTDGVELVIGKTVKTLPNYAFNSDDVRNPKITKVTFEDGGVLESIGAYAFNWCINITEIVIPEGVTTIGNYAFNVCEGLESVTFPSTLTTIGSYAFRQCNSIERFEIPKGVKTINPYAFSECRALKEIYYNAENANNVNTNQNIFYTSGNKAVGIKIIIGKDVVRIPNNLFRQDNGNMLPNYTGLEFEEDGALTTIGACAFYWNHNLSLLNDIPEGVVTIEEYAFSYDYCIKELNLPSTLTTIGRNAFYCLSALETLTLGENITSFGGYVFDYCRNIKQINFNCIRLADFSANNYVFGEAGVNNSGIKLVVGNKVTVLPNYLFYPVANRMPKITSVEFEENSVCTTIGYAAFYNSTYLREITLPESVTTIGAYAFEYCYGLKSVTLPNSLVTIERGAFHYCDKLTSIVIPDKVTTIGDSAFNQCFELQTITLGKGLKTIGTTAFQYCIKLTTININSDAINDLGSGTNAFFDGGYDTNGIVVNVASNVTRLPAYMFYTNNGNYAKVVELKFAENSTLTTIGAYALYNANNLKSITIPESVTTIGRYAFGSSNFDTINFNAIAMNDLAADNNVFYGAGFLTGGVKVTIGENVTKVPAYLFCPGNNSEPLRITEVEFEGDKVVGIGAYAFKGNIFKSIIIPEGVESIGNYAFANCSLENVTIPSTLKTIGSYAFASSRVKAVELPDGLTTINTYAFNDCQLLESVNLPVSLTTLGKGAFNYCYNLKQVDVYSVNLTGVTNSFLYAGTKCEGFKVFIGKDFTSVPTNLFYGYQDGHHLVNATSLEFEEGSKCETIGTCAFENCNLISVKLPDGLLSIGNYAFKLNKNLKEIEIPDSVTSIGTESFYNCSSLQKVNIPKSTTSIGAHAFRECRGLTEINFNAVNLGNFGGENYIFCYAGHSASGITFNVGSEVTRIPAYICRPLNDGHSPKVTSVVFESGSKCTEIGNHAFLYCRNLASVNLPNSLVTIGEHAFSHTALNEVLIPDSVTTIKYAAFHNNSNLRKINLPKNVTTLGNHVFSECRNLVEFNYEAINLADRGYENYVLYYSGVNGTGITFNIAKDVTRVAGYIARPLNDGHSPLITKVVFEDGSKCTEIGNYAFMYCRQLSEIELPDGITTIGEHALSCTAITEMLIPDSVTTIKYAAFHSNPNLTKINVPKNVTTLGNHAFSECRNLVEFNYNATKLNDFGRENYILYYTGTNGSGITFNVGKNVERIPARICYPYTDGYSPKITSVVFEEGSVCTELGYSAFDTCRSLASINLPDSVVTLHEYALASTALKSIVLPDSLTTIKYAALYNNVYLTSVNIPKNVTTIGNSAFDNCRRLTQVYYDAISINDFGGDNYIFINGGYDASGIVFNVGNEVTRIPARLCYPHGHDYSPNLIEIKFEENSVCTFIGLSAFDACYNLKKVNLPDSIVTLDNYVFCNSGLESVKLPANLTTLGVGVFQKNYSLKTVEFNDKLVTIGNNAFDLDRAITSIELPDSVTTIGQYAFSCCESVETLNVPKNVTSIGTAAFNGMYKLHTLNFDAMKANNFGGENYVFQNAGINTSGLTLYIGSEVTYVPQRLFYPQGGVPNLVEVVFEENSKCTALNNWAFHHCYYLKKINLPDSLVSIGQGVFEFCYILEEITIPENVTSIGIYAFYDCLKIKTINYNAKNVANLGNENVAFYDVGSEVSEGVTLTIGNKVTRIPNYLFYPYSNHSPNIDKVVFEEGSVCSEIGSNAFTDCDRLASIVIPNSVLTIGSHAFQSCQGLKNVTMSNSVKTIGNGAFEDCVSLEGITLPQSLTSLGIYAFCNTRNMKEINFNAAKLNHFGSENYVFFDSGEATSGITLNIGNKVEYLPNRIFYPYNDRSPKITSVVFEEDSICATIGVSTFAFCDDLTSIELPNSVTKLDTYAFDYCYSLESVKMSENLVTIGGCAFRANLKLEEITIPATVTSIGNSSFENCRSVTVINYNATNASDLPGDNYAFYNTGLEGEGITLNIAKNVTRIPARVFYPTAYNHPLIRNVVFEDESECITIAHAAFAYIDSLVSVNLPSSLRTIGNAAFAYCNGLKSIVMPEGLTTIDVSAFYNCENLASITVPSTVTTIGTSAFAYCHNLEEFNYNAATIADYGYDNDIFTDTGIAGKGIKVTIGNKVTVIPARLFYPTQSARPPKITELVFEEGSVCQRIGVSAFAYAYYLKNLTLPEGLTNIDNYAFDYSYSLESIDFPNTLTRIGNYAFQHCYGLKSIEIPYSVTTLCEGVFYHCNNISYVYYNATSLPNYNAAHNIFYSIGYATEGVKVVIGNRVERIPMRLFYSSTDIESKITSVEFEEGSVCTTINSYAFYNNKYIKYVSLPKTITTIGDEIFYNCGTLDYVLCASDAVANLVKGKGVSDNCIYVYQPSGGDEATYLDITYYGNIVLGIGELFGYNWVRLSVDNGYKYYMCISK